MCLLLGKTVVASSWGVASRADAQQVAGELWLDVELPTGFHLDLMSGEVKSRPTGDGGASVSYEQGRLVGRDLRMWTRLGAERVAARLVRGGGTPASDPVVALGDELLFEVDAERWGYLRILASDPEALRIEVAVSATGTRTEAMEREPRLVRAHASGGRCELSWFPAEDAQVEYRVTRRLVIAADGEDEAEAREVARVQGGAWTDESLTPGALAEYRVARVHADGGGGFGARVRAVEVERPGDWPIEMVAGIRLDVLTGAVNSPRAHLEFPYLQPPSLTVRPLDGTRILAASKNTRGLGWLVPDTQAGRYMDQLRSVPITGTLAVALPSGIYARLLFEHEPGGSVRAWRQLDLYGERTFPIAPAAPTVETPADEQQIVLRFAALPADAPDPGDVALVVERELRYLADDWEEIAVGPGGERVLRLDPLQGRDADAPPLARFRFRHRYPFGLASMPGEPIELLLVGRASEDEREALVDRSMADLVHADFERRVLARGVLAALGETAWPRLREALSSDTPELKSAARELLLAADSASDSNFELVLRAQADAAGISGTPPPELYDASPNVRAWGLLRGGDSDPEGELAGWAHVLSQIDPDEATSRFASHLAESGKLVRATGGVAPYVLIPPAERRAAVAREWRYEALERDPADLARVAREAVDPARPVAALVYLEIAAVLDRIAREHSGAWPSPAVGPDGEVGDDPADLVELALRLVRRFERTDVSTIIESAQMLIDDPGAGLQAMSDLLELRFGAGAAEPAQPRERIEVDEPDLEVLENLIVSLKSEGRTYVDVVLVPGEWTFGADATDRWVDLELDGLRLVGNSDVRVSGGFRVQNARDVVLDGIAVQNTQGAAIFTTRGSVTLVDCDLAGMQGTVTAQDADVELSDCRLSNAMPERPSGWSLRQTGGGVVLARNTLFEGGTVMPGDEGFLYFERCIVDSGSRTVIQGARSAHVVLRDVLLRSTGAGLYNVSRGTLHGVVMQVARDPLGRGDHRLGACPTSVVLLGGAELDAAHLLSECAVEGR
ncbi:MAG: hypothetical protein GY711_18140 [bacterium]|nr:hypothetical protein [bacterium]